MAVLVIMQLMFLHVYILSDNKCASDVCMYTMYMCIRTESDQLHEDVRSGRSVDRMEEDNAPSKG